VKHVGIDVGGTKCFGVIVDTHGIVLHEVRYPTPHASELIDLLEAMFRELGGETTLGVGVPGLITADGVIKASPNMKGAHNIPVGPELRRRLGIAVHVENDATAAAYGEWKSGAAMGARDAVMVTLGTGIGDDLQALEGVQRLHWVLVANDGGLSTPSVYQRLDELRAARGEDPVAVTIPESPELLIKALQSGDAAMVATYLHNDLQEAAVDLMPQLAETMAAGLAAGALAAIVSGSGPTVAMLAQNEDSATSLANQLSIQGYTAIPTFGPAAGTIMEAN
jgi:hypothetical protein